MYHILMIDDEPQQITSHIAYLQEKDCIVEHVPSIPQAVAALKKHSYDLVLLDAKLPKYGGLENCALLLEMTSSPIIILSNYTDEEAQLRGFSAGAADYIPKDCGLDLFWAKITARLKTTDSNNLVRVFPPLFLDLQRQKATLGQTPLQLTQTEFTLLTLLSSQPGHIWTVEDIYREHWGSDGPVNVTMVQMHLSRMRRKMEEAFPQHEFIVTVWGKGYQFVPMS